MTNITFMENAIVLDYDAAKPKQPTPSPYTTPYGTGMDSTLLANVPSSYTTFSDSIYPSKVSINPLESSLPPVVHVNPTYTSFTGYNQYPHTAAQSSSDATKTWQESLAHQTNLDKLSALQKPKQHKAADDDGLAAKELQARIAADQARAARDQEFRRIVGMYTPECFEGRQASVYHSRLTKHQRLINARDVPTDHCSRKT